MAVDLVTELDAGATLAGLELVVRRRRAVDVDDLLLVARWCELQSTDPREDPRPRPDLPRPPGSDRLVVLGGDGTPGVRELTLAELGIARGVHILAARAVAADVLDLRHRLPATWTVFLTGRCEGWVARRVASLTRNLSRHAVRLVDSAAAGVIGSQSPGRVIAVVEAKIIEADTAAHQAEVEKAKRARFVSLSRTDAYGLRHVIARINAGDAAYIDAVIARVAEILATRPTHAETPREELRAVAFGWLARPAELLELLLTHTEQPEPETEPEVEVEDEPEPAHLPRAMAFPADLLDALRSIDPKQLRPRVVLYVHLHQDALTGTPGVARVETIGPHALSQLGDLLARTHITLKPVIDLTDRVSVNAYEHPTRIAERIHLEKPGDAFPHATTMTRTLDLDHMISYRAQGPPGQTGTHTSQPLTRTAHRAKTHLGYRASPLPTGETLWTTPNGLTRIVDHTGTHHLSPDDAAALTGPDPLQRALVRLMIKHRAGRLT